ncbi:MAG: XdhC family protein [Pseudomonadota bacterium]
MDLQRVLQFLLQRQGAGDACVLVTVCAVEGSSMRNPGSIMAVSETGEYEGSLSGGCIENAVVAEARQALEAGAPRVVRFGAGSPFLDIKLPCGGGLDVHFCPTVDHAFTAQCLDLIAQRTPFSIALSPSGAEVLREWRPTQFDPEADAGVFGHWPVPKIQIIGHGAAVEALVKLSPSMGCTNAVLTPDERLLPALKDYGPVTRLERINQTDLLNSDPWTALIFLFHDHDWEIDLMERALELPHFYIGAMGGRRAHAARCAALLARGVSQEKLDTIRAPIGVFHSSRDPQTLALSTLAQVIRTYHETDFAAQCERALG